jgi:hypothetical protein
MVLTLAPLLWGLLACSEPAFYPSITAEFDSAAGADGGGDGGDGGAPDGGIDGLDLTGVPCAPASVGPGWLYAVDNQHAGPVRAWAYGSDCALTDLGALAAGAQQAFGQEGEVYVYTDDPPTAALAWLQVLPNDAASVVIP